MRALRHPRRFGQLALTLLVTLLFLAVSSLPRFTPPAYAGNEPASPLPVAEDPLGQSPEQQTPESSVDVDVRDGHLTVRVVDIWGPGRTPFVVRSYTNTVPSTTSSVGTSNPDTTRGVWQFNHLSDIVPIPDVTDRVGVREPDGNRAEYKMCADAGGSEPCTRYNPSYSEMWKTHTKDIGTYSTMETHYTCVPGDPGLSVRPTAPAPRAATPPAARPYVTRVRPAGTTLTLDCTWDGYWTVFLPKGRTRRYVKNPAVGQESLPPQTMPGLIVEEKDANGNTATFTQTTFGDQIRKYVATVRDPVNRVTTYTYEHSHQECVQEGNQGCLLWKWHYRVRQVTDPWGRSATYTYGTNGRLTSGLNGAGFTTSYGYDTYGRLNAVTNARGHATGITWTTLQNKGRVTRVTAPGGAQTNYAYTFAGGQLTRTVVTDALSHATTHEFYVGTDEKQVGNVIRTTDALNNVTQYAYDDRHNVTQVTDARQNRTTYQYNTRNKVTQVIKAVGTLNLTTTATWDAYDNQLTLVNPRNVRTEYTYDTKHNLTQVKKAAGTGQDESITQYVYNIWGGVERVIDPRGYATIYAYTTRHQIQTITPPPGTNNPINFTYDAYDDQRTKVDGNNHTWSTTYNAQRLVTQEVDPLNYAVTHQYDPNGNRTHTTDAKTKTTIFTYDERDRLTRITDPYGKQTQYQYDAVSNLKKIINARTFETNFDYDAVNRLSRVTDARGKYTTFQYDPVGNRTQMVDRKTQTHVYTYDQANRLTQVVANPGNQTIQYAYLPTGVRQTMTDATGLTTYGHDNLDRLTSTQYPDGRTVTATYDDAGNRITFTNPGATTTTAWYDGANRLTQLTQGSLTWTFGYDGAGNRTSLTHPNGTSVTYAYLNNDWLSSITDKAPGGTPFQSTSYGYDPNGNRTSQTDPSGQTTFGYDDLNRLTSAAYPGGYGTWGWTYDDVGNRLTQTGPGGTTTYAYDANNRLTQAVAGTTVTYGYDDNGNLLTISTGQTFTWDVLNRLTQATGAGGTATYTYNGDGLKTRRVGPSSTTNYYHDGIRSIYETNAQGQMTLQLDRDIFGNLLSAQDGSGTRRYLHIDGLGSVTALTTPSGTVAATMLYDAWGNQRAISGSGHGNYRFTGAEMDATTGLYHMGARFYDSVIGRWLSEDPVQDKPFEPASLNFYAYVANNPVLLTDPKGTTPEQPPTPISPEEVRERARQTLEKIANQLGITVEELLQWADRLAKIGGILMAVGAVLSAVALAAYGGAITGVVAAIVADAFVLASVAGAVASTIALGIQFFAGKISFGQLVFGLATAWTPGVGTKAVAGMIGKAPTIAQMTRASLWGLARGWNMGSWVLNWR